MSRNKSLRLEAEGVLELLRDYDALRTWEVLRTARAVVTAGELAAAMGVESRVLQRHLDLLARHGLVHGVRARKPRRSVGYRVATERIVVAFDDSRAESVQKAMESSDSVRRASLSARSSATRATPGGAHPPQQPSTSGGRAAAIAMLRTMTAAAHALPTAPPAATTHSASSAITRANGLDDGLTGGPFGVGERER